MPNWCHNVLTVSGDSAAIACFAAKAPLADDRAQQFYDWDDQNNKPPLEEWLRQWRATHPLSFDSFVPLPEASESLLSWTEENWGTKWEARFADARGVLAYAQADPALSLQTTGVVTGEQVLVYKFLTAWSPPEPAVAAMADQHPELEFVLRFAEYGNGFAGQQHFVDGQLVEEIELLPHEAFAPEEHWF